MSRGKLVQLAPPARLYREPATRMVAEAAAAGKILGFDADLMVNALSIAGSHASGTKEYDQNGGSVKRMHAGMAAHGGMRSALIARRGILYALASAVLIGFYLTVVEQVNAAVAGAFKIDARIVEPVFLIIALTLFQPAVAKLEESLDRMFELTDEAFRIAAANRPAESLISLPSGTSSASSRRARCRGPASPAP